MEEVFNHQWTIGDSVLLNDIFQEFSTRKVKIDQDKEKERQEKLLKRKKMQEAEGDSERSADKFPEYFAIWEGLKLDPSLLKETEEVDKNSLIVDEDPRSFVALVTDFLTNKTKNLLNDESEIEMFAVDLDPEQQEVYVTMNYSVTVTLEDR